MQKDEQQNKEKDTTAAEAKETPDTVTERQAAAPAIEQELQKALKEKDEYVALAQRVQADFDNFRKRNALVRSDACAQGCADTVAALLPVLDNLERAVNAGESKEGIALILRQFRDILKKMGVEEIPSSGCKFDPNVHEALMQAPPSDGKEAGDVLAVIEKGYTMEGKILRHAKVQVAGE